jgi:predicted nuclease of predicted toxin-antitoxin system
MVPEAILKSGIKTTLLIQCGNISNNKITKILVLISSNLKPLDHEDITL